MAPPRRQAHAARTRGRPSQRANRATESGARPARGWRGRRWAAVDPRRWSTRVVAAVVVLLTAGDAAGVLRGKARCVGPTFDDKGRTTPDYDIRIDRDLCYSDIQYLWLDRDIDKHVFPYVHGGITPPPDSKLTGGAVEYPVLTGLLMWAGAMFAHNDGEFLLYSALLMAPFGLLTGWMLARLARWRALVWALGPTAVPLRLPQLGPARRGVRGGRRLRDARLAHPQSLRQRATLAAVLLGLGFAFKLYPGAFVAPLMLYVLTTARPGSRDWWGAAASRSPPPPRWCWSTCRSRSRATTGGARRSRSRSCARSTSPPTRSGSGASAPTPSPPTRRSSAG